MVKLKFWHILILVFFIFTLSISIIISLILNNGNLKDYLENSLAKQVSYQYEVCNDNGECKMITIDKVVQPSRQTFNICNDKGFCEDVPLNRLLLKEGTDKKYCSSAPYLETDYVDNWWNANGLIDECEMPPESDMQFTFKQHNQTIISYTGTIQISITAINYEDNYLALQILTADDHDGDNLPDEWIHCGNVDEINGKDLKIIYCSGTNLKFVKLSSAEWNPTSIFIDRIEILKVD